MQEVERHAVPDRLVGGPVHRLQTRFGSVDADHQGNRHAPVSSRGGCHVPGLLLHGSTCDEEGIGVLLEGEKHRARHVGDVRSVHAIGLVHRHPPSYPASYETEAAAMQPVVTLGLDGSPESLAAARWAADEAQKRRLTLRLLHAWPLLAPEPARVPSEVDQNYWAKRFVRTAQAELQARHPDLTIVGSPVADDAQNALPQAASESETTVLGSRGPEPVESYFPGDVSMPVVARAERPVVLVRAETREEGAHPAPASRVVVALKLNGSSDDPLDFAFHTAAARGVPLLAVHGRSVPLHARLPWGVDHAASEEMTRDAQKQLTKALRPWRDKYPQMDVADTIRPARPAKAVVQAAEGAAPLVVGRHEHRRGPAPHLAPVAQAAIHHGRCVAVVPHD
jgi:nucleotide-binding universal stress UspA family protein